MKTRLDVLLVERGLAESRAQAQALVLAGLVRGYDKPGQHRSDAALDYWKDLPTCWDETRVLAGRIGRCASVARRRGTEWFVGTINPGGGDVPIPLSFLEPGVKYTAMVYSDRDVDDPTSDAVKAETIPVDRTTILKSRMPINGGQAVRIVRATER